MTTVVIGWLALAAVVVLALFALDRHTEWLRRARLSIDRGRRAEKLLKRPSYDYGHTYGKSLAQQSEEWAREVPGWCRDFYLRLATEEIASEQEEERLDQEDAEAATKLRRRLERRKDRGR